MGTLNNILHHRPKDIQHITKIMSQTSETTAQLADDPGRPEGFMAADETSQKSIFAGRIW